MSDPTSQGREDAGLARLQAALKRAFPLISCSLVGIAFALAAARFFVLDANDRYKCHALLNDGEWLDAGLSSRDSLSNWQPDGCILYSHSPKTAKACLVGRRVVFAGDSTVRQLFYATAALLDPSLHVPEYAPESSAVAADASLKHQDITTLAGGADFEFVWDPYLNSSRLDRLFTNPKGKRSEDQIPALLVLGSGLWHLRNPESGGLKSWTKAMDRVFSATEARHDQVADEVVLMPVQNTIPDKLSKERKLTLLNDDIDKMNAELRTRLPPFSSSGISQLSIPYVFNEMINLGLYSQAKAKTKDGLHFDPSILKAQANVILNLRCNDVLPKQFPFDKTCCNQYPAPNWLQGIMLLVILMWAPFGIHLYGMRGNPSSLRFFPPAHVLQPLTIFGFSIVFMYFSDRTSLFLKIAKQFDFWQFTVAMLAALALGVGTMKRPEKDLGFLNRDQTDEWKGWMQIAILIYHYYGASKISGIYNPIRVLVAAYLFMSGYGHFFFYYKKADYGLARVAAVLIRLNLLTLVLTYIQDTDYLSYYFSPLTTLWFGVIWVTMYVGHSYNARSAPFMLSKLALSAGLMAAFHHLGWPLATLFGVFNALFGTQWNAREWTFRVTLDMWIVYGGMLAAFAFIKIGEHKLWERPWWASARRYSIVAAGVAMAGYFYFELQYNKLDYNLYHPYISFIPVLAFIVLRNATPFLRSTSSKAYIWIGQCSLETFICQFHIWLGGDTKGLLVLLPFPRWRFLNMVFTTVIFLFLSNQIAVTTGALTDWICGKQPKGSAGGGGRKPGNGAGNGGVPGTGGSQAAYIPLTQVTTENGVTSNAEAPPASPLLHTSSFESKLNTAVSSLPVRLAFVMGLIWVINILYPNAHPSQGHLLPTH